MLIEKYCNLKDRQLRLNFSLEKYTFHNIVTCNPAMLKQIEMINKISNSPAPAIIFGETGTGKELYAEYIHYAGLRKDKNFAKVNCATIPEKLFESEMFGYEPGAFTGALKTGKKGIFEIADKGTLFLDEISEMPLPLQSKLLRVLQENRFVKVGGYTEIVTNVRLIAASNKDLKQLAEEGGFRKDLFYRLNVIPVRLLPLRERKEDIIALSFYFLDRFNRTYQAEKKMSLKLMEAFLDYNWPGNVRELRNAIERLVLLSDVDLLEDDGVLESTLEKKDPYSLNDTNVEKTTPIRVRAFQNIEGNITLKDLVAEYEIFIIKKYVEETGSIRKAAKALNTSPSVLSRKLSQNRSAEKTKTE